MRRKQIGKSVFLVRSQRTGIHVGLIVQLLQYFFHFNAAGLGHTAPGVKYTVYCSHRYSGHLGDVLDSDSILLFLHAFLPYYIVKSVHSVKIHFFRYKYITYFGF